MLGRQCATGSRRAAAMQELASSRTACDHFSHVAMGQPLPGQQPLYKGQSGNPCPHFSWLKGHTHRRNNITNCPLEACTSLPFYYRLTHSLSLTTTTPRPTCMCIHTYMLTMKEPFGTKCSELGSLGHVQPNLLQVGLVASMGLSFLHMNMQGSN